MPTVSTQTIDVTQPITQDTALQISQDIVDLGVFKPRTDYLLIGDEPQNYQGVLNLNTVVAAKDLEPLKQYLTLMPRDMLWNFFMKKFWPGIPDAAPGSMFRSTQFTSIYGDTHFKKPFEEMVWAGLVDLFNVANLKYVNDNKMDPWDWEAQKTEAYYTSTSKSAIDALNAQIEQYNAVELALDPKASTVMENYIKLPKLGDVGLEINRQNAIKELLKQKEYDTAQAIVDAYRYIADTELGPLILKPIPYDIVTPSGDTIVRAT